jgi:hypothetical protein
MSDNRERKPTTTPGQELEGRALAVAHAFDVEGVKMRLVAA